MAFQDNFLAALDARGWGSAHMTAALFDRGDQVDVKTVVRWMDGTTEPHRTRKALVADILKTTVDALDSD